MKEKIIYSNISKNLENKFFYSNKTLGDNTMSGRLIDHYKNKGIPGFADHEQRLGMDGLKNMLEAMIDGEDEIAKMYGNMNDEMKGFYEQFSKLDKKELYRQRTYQTGYTVDEDTDEQVEEIFGWIFPEEVV